MVSIQKNEVQQRGGIKSPIFKVVDRRFLNVSGGGPVFNQLTDSVSAVNFNRLMKLGSASFIAGLLVLLTHFALGAVYRFMLEGSSSLHSTLDLSLTIAWASLILGGMAIWITSSIRFLALDSKLEESQEKLADKLVGDGVLVLIPYGKGFGSSVSKIKTSYRSLKESGLILSKDETNNGSVELQAAIVALATSISAPEVPHHLAEFVSVTSVQSDSPESRMAAKYLAAVKNNEGAENDLNDALDKLTAKSLSMRAEAIERGE